MSKKTKLPPTPVDPALFKDIAAIAPAYHAHDASGAIQTGAVLLAIGRATEEYEDRAPEGLVYILGLERGTKWHPHFECFFGIVARDFDGRVK